MNRTHASASGPLVLIYDGKCAFCQKQVARLMHMAGNLRIETRSYHDPGVLEAFPSLTLEDCERAMQLIDPAGRIHVGADAVVYLMLHSTRWRWLGWLAWIPGVKPMLRWVYSRIAQRRYQLGQACAQGCATHLSQDRPSMVQRDRAP